VVEKQIREEHVNGVLTVTHSNLYE